MAVDRGPTPEALSAARLIAACRRALSSNKTLPTGAMHDASNERVVSEVAAEDPENGMVYAAHTSYVLALRVYLCTLFLSRSYTYIYIYIYIYIYLVTITHICILLYMLRHMYICIYTYIHIRGSCWQVKKSMEEHPGHHGLL